MKKLSNISESMWGDIHRRNSGEVARKEDDVNFMDFETFGEYLRNFNKKEVTRVYLDPAGKFITIDEIDIILETKERSYERHYQLLLTIEYSESKEVKEIRLPYSFKVFEGNVYSKMTKEFSISTKRTSDLNISHLNINPKDGSKKTNRFFLDVLNFLVDNLKNRYLNESMWGDIHRRNSGEAIRKEDDINLLDENDFEKYLQDHYNVINGYSIYNLGGITVPVLKSSCADERTFALIYDGIYQDIDISDDLQDYYPQLYKELQKEFVLSHRGCMFNITPKSGEKCTNKFCIEVLDFIINNAKKDLIIEKR